MKKCIEEIIAKEMALDEDIRPLYHRNCAETLLMAANKKYDLGLEDRYYKAVCPYGAGLQSGKTCGALLGSLASIGILFAEDKPTENEKMKALTEAYVTQFLAFFESQDCELIKPRHQDENETCTPVKIKAGELLEELLCQEKIQDQ